MTTLASGRQQVHRLLTALGGPVPKEAQRRAIQSLERRMNETFRQRSRLTAESSRLLLQAQAPIHALLRADKRAAENVRKLRAVMERRSRQRAAKPRMVTMEPRFATGSSLTVKAPPYDEDWTWNKGTPATMTANKNNGTFSFSIRGGGGNTAAAAGVGVWFWSTANHPGTRFSALVDFGFNWFDSSTGGYVAHNSADVRMYVWGDKERAWVDEQGGFDPRWSDGTGWYEDHHDADEGRLAERTFFPTTANSWYLAWVWASGSVHDSSGSVWGFSFACANMNISVPFVVFEQ